MIFNQRTVTYYDENGERGAVIQTDEILYIDDIPSYTVNAPFIPDENENFE